MGIFLGVIIIDVKRVIQQGNITCDVLTNLGEIATNVR